LDWGPVCCAAASTRGLGWAALGEARPRLCLGARILALRTARYGLGVTVAIQVKQMAKDGL
jgi:hypothetical protein